MALIDQLLNLIGLVLWLAWRGTGRASAVQGAGTLLSNLKPAEARPTKRWVYLLALLGLLLVRPLLYSTLAGNLNWTPLLGLGSTTLAFRADYLVRLVCHSFLSFGWTWLVADSWLLFLITVTALEREPDGWTRLFRQIAGWAGRWPVPLPLLLPTLAAGLGWVLAVYPLAGCGVLPEVPPVKQLLGQAGVIGLSVWLSLKWLVGGILLLRLVSTYVYFGSHPMWDFVQRTGGILLRPLQWLPVRFGKLDFTPLVAIALVWLAWWGLELGLARTFSRLSL